MAATLQKRHRALLLKIALLDFTEFSFVRQKNRRQDKNAYAGVAMIKERHSIQVKDCLPNATLRSVRGNNSILFAEKKRNLSANQ